MDKETLKALKQSIKKWERRASGEQVDESCPLCDLFNDYDRAPKLICLGCPVYEKTGKKECRGTPYMEWFSAKFSEEKIYATQEVKFLKSLLPKKIKQDVKHGKRMPA